MKIILLIILSLSEIYALNFSKHISINAQDFTIIKENYNIYDSKGVTMTLRDKNLKSVLTLILNDATGSCSSKSIEEGTYSIEGSNITLYHRWRRVGKAYNAPYGGQIEEYFVDKNGKFSRVSSKVYIESSRKNYDPDSGMRYLFKAPINAKEKKHFKDYIDFIERIYKGTFVYGDEATRLMQNIKEALEKKRKDRWKK